MKRQRMGWGKALVVAGGVLALAAAGVSNATGKADVRAVEGPALKEAITAQKGKVVVLNLWATWCGPCVEEFPDLVKLHNNYHSKGVAVVGASLDEPEDKEKVAAFLTEQKADFPCYVRSKGEPEAFIDPVDKKWPGAVPVTYIYDRAGKLVGEPHVGLQSYEKFETAVKKALEK